jgi:hypothetical protein
MIVSEGEPEANKQGRKRIVNVVVAADQNKLQARRTITSMHI